jgi:hypothetical protein
MTATSIDRYPNHSVARISLALLLIVLLVSPDLALAQEPATSCNSSGSNSGWTPFPSTSLLPNPIETLNAVVNNGYLYVVGGSEGTTGFQNTVSYVQLSTSTGLPLTAFQSTTPLPVALSRDLCGVAHNGFLYTVGGVEYSSTDSNGQTVGSVQYAPFHPATGTIGTWNPTSSLPEVVQLHGTVVLNGYMYVIGGSTYKDVSNAPSKITDAVYYAPINSDGTLGSFTQTASLLIPLYKTCPVAIDGTIYMIGGETNAANETTPGDPAVNTVYYATPNTTGSQIGAISSWTKAPYTIPLSQFNTMNPSGLAAQAVAYDNTKGIVLMGGDTTGNGGDTDVPLEGIDPSATTITWDTLPTLPANVSRNAGATLNHYAYSVAGLVAGSDSNGVNCLLID